MLPDISEDSPLIKYDFRGWAEWRRDQAQAEHDSPYSDTNDHQLEVEAWSELIARLDARDRIGVCGCLAFFANQLDPDARAAILKAMKMRNDEGNCWASFPVSRTVKIPEAAS